MEDFNIEDYLPEDSVQKNVDKARALFENNIPLVDTVRRFPEHYLLPFGCAAYFVLGFLYVFFFAFAYQQSVEESYISLDSSSGVCTEIERPLTGIYLATDRHWEGDSSFLYSEAKYEFTFSGLEATSGSFSSLIEDGFNTDAAALFTSEHDVADNLLLWMHYQKFVEVGGKTQRFSMLSSPRSAPYSLCNNPTSTLTH
ncbi:hypothetical protein B484DRAFT_440361 [Ochromonadaceae sp. CCMP2298]|nr:hypothetical protein B484DRAFT_440361 [Ochromonadaceae sp. CCMP2298]